MNKFQVLVLVGITNICQYLTDKLLMISTWAVSKCCPEEFEPHVIAEERDHSVITSKEQFIAIFSETGPVPDKRPDENLDFDLPLTPLEGHFQLSDEAYDRFEQQLNNNPLSKNKTLEEFLKRDNRWSS